MAHLVSLGEPQAARAIAERALGGTGVCIGYREQREQLNVWIAYLNLEASCGEEPRETAVAQLFARAAPRCDPKPLHLALVGIHERAGQSAAALSACHALCRKFKSSCKAWLRRFALHLACAAPDAQRACLDRAVAALPRRKHSKFLVAAALAEFRGGEPERGRALFEGVLAAQPRRADVWGVYLDAEAKQGGRGAGAESERYRSLLARCVAGPLPPKRMKSLFKRALAAQRTDEGVAWVRALAEQYVAGVQAEHGAEE
jgi:rRNA biogenesis protein RRP5